MQTHECPEPARPDWRASLSRLLESRGVLAAVLATGEGLPLAGRVAGGPDSDALAAAAVELARLGANAVAEAGGRCTIVVMEASRLRLMLRPLPFGHLIVVSEPSAEPGPLLAEVEDVAAEMAAGEALVG